jgi:hypothetical protein
MARVSTGNFVLFYLPTIRFSNSLSINFPFPSRWSFGILIYELIVGQPPWISDDLMGIYQSILGGKLLFPRFFDAQAKVLTKSLLVPDLTKRIGCLKVSCFLFA